MAAERDWFALRFRDLDAFGHVYHAEFLTLLDEARTRWFATRQLEQPGLYVVAHLEIDWVSPLGPDDSAVSVAFAVQGVGTTSVTLAETMSARDGRTVSRSRSVTVRWDPGAGRPRELSLDERTKIGPPSTGGEAGHAGMVGGDGLGDLSEA